MGSSGIRLTYATAMVLQALDEGVRYGFDVIDATGLRSGTVYPVLRRLEDAGLVSSSWEDAGAAHSENRPPRRYYRLEPAADPLLARARERYPAPADVPAPRAAGEETG